jgi:hypothetical protein
MTVAGRYAAPKELRAAGWSVGNLVPDGVLFQVHRIRLAVGCQKRLLLQAGASHILGGDALDPHPQWLREMEAIAPDACWVSETDTHPMVVLPLHLERWKKRAQRELGKGSGMTAVTVVVTAERAAAEGVADPATARRLLPPQLLDWGEGVRVKEVRVVHKPPTTIRTPREEWRLPPRNWVERALPADRSLVMVTVVRRRERDEGVPLDIQVGDDGDPPPDWKPGGYGDKPVWSRSWLRWTPTNANWPVPSGAPLWTDYAWPWRPW